jgi:parvulin-like peptidyl-prolyl isomerase
VLAVVGEEEITNELYEESYVNYLAQSGANDTQAEREKHLQYLIDTILLKQEARRLQLDTTAYSQTFMQRKIDRSLVDAYLKVHLYDTLSTVSEEEVKAVYPKTKRDLFVRQLYFTNREQAETYKQRLNEGEDFVDLANELYQTETYSDKAGYLGKVSYLNLDAAYAEAAYELNVGEVSDLVMGDNGFYIIRVENWAENPLMTEAGFEKERDKLTFLLQEKRYHKASAQFIRSQMQELNVTPDKRRIYQLFKVAQQHFNPSRGDLPVNDVPKKAFGDEEIQLIEQQFNPESILARYKRKNGKEVAFTAADFLYWMPMMEANEILNRTIPAVGRAIYFQEFSKRAKEENLEELPLIQFNTDYVKSFHFADLVQNHLKNQPVDAEDIPDQFIQEIKQNLDVSVEIQTKAEYWVAGAENLAEAQKISEKLRTSEESDWRSIAEFHKTDHLEQDTGKLGKELASTINSDWQIISDGNEIFVAKVKVLDQQIEKSSLSEDEIRERVKKEYPVHEKLKELRSSTNITIKDYFYEHTYASAK